MRYLDKKAEIEQYVKFLETVMFHIEKIFYKDIEVNVHKYQELLAQETSDLGFKPKKSPAKSVAESGIRLSFRLCIVDLMRLFGWFRFGPFRYF